MTIDNDDMIECYEGFMEALRYFYNTSFMALPKIFVESPIRRLKDTPARLSNLGRYFREYMENLTDDSWVNMGSTPLLSVCLTAWLVQKVY